jgi:hypothetical protein
MALVVRSHVSRDLLQSAAMFKNERLLVWEYVSNGLQYVDPGTSPVVRVRLDSTKRRITIDDNGRGMDMKGLENFFVMHGENIDRVAGSPGRGRFGTGKSAAFGVGDLLRLTTVRNGRRSKVELTRAALEAAADGDPVPVRTLEEEVPTDQSNGTLVEIEGIHLRSLDQPGVAHYIERHLARWPKDVTVLVNNHQCEFNEPPLERVETFTPDEAQKEVLGDVVLQIKVSKSPLDHDLRGISIFGNGVWHETTSLASAGKDMGDFIFGEIDVPLLDDESSTPPPFDASRSLKLNPDNELVRAIYAFVGPRLETVRKELVEAQREQRATEEAKRLRREASQIENIINNDFDAFRKRLQKVKTATAGTGFDVSSAEEPTGDGDGDDDFLYGGDQSAVVVFEEGETGHEHGEGEAGAGPPRRLNPIVAEDENGATRGHHEKRSDKGKPRQRGGFNIEFDNQGEASARATYQSDKRTIYVNLDHPQIAAAKKTHGVEDAVFRRLAYEVAFSEYAVALASELEFRGEYIDPSDPIVDIRETINRVARSAARLYAEG